MSAGHEDLAERQQRRESPLACNLLALDAEGQRQHRIVTKELKGLTKEVRSLGDGYAFRFPTDHSTHLLVAEFIARERLCCPFLEFRLITEKEDGPLWLELRGREGVKDFIKIEFGLR